MTKRTVLFLGVLAMSILSIASAKSYNIAFPSRTVVGKAQLTVLDPERDATARRPAFKCPLNRPSGRRDDLDRLAGGNGGWACGTGRIRFCSLTGRGSASHTYNIAHFWRLSSARRPPSTTCRKAKECRILPSQPLQAPGAGAGTPCPPNGGLWAVLTTSGTWKPPGGGARRAKAGWGCRRTRRWRGPRTGNVTGSRPGRVADA